MTPKPGHPPSAKSAEPMDSSQRDLMQRISVFGALKPDTLDFLLERSVTVSCAAGEWFFRQGDPAQSVYILESGRVEVLKHWQGRTWLLRYLDAGECFGEMALMDMSSRSASVRAAQDSRAFKISAASLLALYGHDLEQFTLLQMNLGREVSRRLRLADELVFRCHMEGVAEGDEPMFVPLDGED